MNLAAGYAIAGFFCAVACLIVAVQAMRSTTGLVSTEPAAIAAISGAFVLASWLNWSPGNADVLCGVAIGFSVLAAWAAWKDAAAAARLLSEAQKRA